MIEQTLGNSLRFLREQQGISLRALAERTDFSASFLSQIENGQCSPSISSMEKIAYALGVTLGQFFLSANQQVVNIVRASDRAHMALDWSRAEIAQKAVVVGECVLEPARPPFVCLDAVIGNARDGRHNDRVGGGD